MYLVNHGMRKERILFTGKAKELGFVKYVLKYFIIIGRIIL